MITTTNNRRSRATALASIVKLAKDVSGTINYDQVIKSAKKMYDSAKKGSARKKGPEKRETVAKASKETMAPTSYGMSSTNLIRTKVYSTSGSVQRMKGVAYLGTVNTGAILNAQPSCVLFAPSNPVTFLDRLQVTASTFDKYVYNSVCLRYVPAVGTNTAGKIAIAIDRDYMDPPQSQNWGEAISYESVASGNVWSQHSCGMRRETTEKRTYFTNPYASTEFRETEQFKFYVYAQGVPVSTFCGDLYLEYDIDLISPVYAPKELTNLSSLPVTSVGGVSVTMSSLTAQAVINVLPFADNSNDIFELVFQTPINNANLTFNNASGQPYYGDLGGSARLFARSYSNVNDARTYALYVDYPSAIGNGGAVLFNSGGSTATLFNNANVTWRRLSYTQGQSV